MTIIEQIKAEIERKRDQNRKGENSYYDVNDIKNAGICRHRRILCEELLSFLSTLESEKQMNLEEEINRYLREECSDDDEPSVSDIAHHFAKWGAEHLDTSGKTISVKPGDEITINGHKIIYDKDKGYVTIVKSEEFVPNDPNQAAVNWICSHKNGEVLYVKDAFIAGYKYRAEHAPLPEDTVLFNKGVEEGKRLMMMDAVDAIVEDWNPDPEPEITIPLNPEEFTRGDKVRIIIVKE